MGEEVYPMVESEIKIIRNEKQLAVRVNGKTLVLYHMD